MIVNFAIMWFYLCLLPSTKFCSLRPFSNKHALVSPSVGLIFLYLDYCQPLTLYVCFITVDIKQKEEEIVKRLKAKIESDKDLKSFINLIEDLKEEEFLAWNNPFGLNYGYSKNY
jgi:hypothetical protein